MNIKTLMGMSSYFLSTLPMMQKRAAMSLSTIAARCIIF